VADGSDAPLLVSPAEGAVERGAEAPPAPTPDPIEPR
jgi:hypothetical protein